MITNTEVERNAFANANTTMWRARERERIACEAMREACANRENPGLCKGDYWYLTEAWELAVDATVQATTALRAVKAGWIKATLDEEGSR